MQDILFNCPLLDDGGAGIAMLTAYDPADLLQRMKRRGWKITSQRRAVAQALAGRHVHRTAEQVFDRAKQVLPEISLATVYNALRELVAMKEVREIHAGPTLFDPNIDPHHHLVCVTCGEMLDVHACGAEGLHPQETYGYEVLGHSITFEGHCRRCAH